ncbi:MAG: cyclic nucleotide-binding domain-containing protein [Patescibacteria group bacterium]
MVDNKILKPIPLFNGLTSVELSAIAAIINVEKVPRNTQLFKKGDTRSTFYIVESGRMHLYRKFREEQQTLAILDPYDFVVESSLSNPHEDHQHYAETWEDSTLLTIRGKDFLKFSKSKPAIANRIYAAIIENITSRLHHANNKIITLYTTGKIAASYEDIYNLAELLLEAILEMIKADKALLALYDPDSNKTVIHEAIGYSNNQKIKNLKISTSDDLLLGTIYRDKADIVVTRQEYNANKKLHTAYASPTMLGVKIQTSDDIIGAILLGDKEKGQNFSYNNHILLDIISRQIALALREAEIKEQQAGNEDIKRVYIKPFSTP